MGGVYCYIKGKFFLVLNVLGLEKKILCGYEWKYLMFENLSLIFIICIGFIDCFFALG